MSESRETVDAPPGLEFGAKVARITLQRPREHNRIDPGDVHVLRAHLATIRSEADVRDVRAVVLRGTGDATFSSGYTIDAIVEALDHSFEDLLDQIETFPLPTICAIRGNLYGGATDLALACDFRIGAWGIRMFVPAARFGLHFYPGGMRRFVSRLGLTQAKKILLTGQAIDAPAMLAIGFLTELVDADAVESTVADYVAALAAGDPGVVQSMKAQLDAIARGDPGAALSRSGYERSLGSAALRERLAAWRSRRDE